MTRKAGSGYIVKPEDAVGLANTIRHVIENKEEAQKRTRVGAEYIGLILSRNSVVGEMEETYEDRIRDF